MASDVNGFDESPGNSTADPITLLQELERTYCVMVNQSDYGPAQSAGKRQVPSLEAMIGELVDAKMAQDRTAKSTTGASKGQGGGGGVGQKGACFGCGSLTHYQGDPACPKYSAPSESREGSSAPGSKHGLDEATHAKVVEACKVKSESMPPRDHIADSDKFCVTIGGKDLAKYCRHCGRWTKGDGAHFTADHQGTRRRHEYKGPPPAASGSPPSTESSGAPSVAFAAGQLASASPTLSPPDGLDLSSVPQISAEDFAQGRQHWWKQKGLIHFVMCQLMKDFLLFVIRQLE